jgi:SAM-dependent methyltransferase
MDDITQAERERLEIKFWESSETEGPGIFSIENLLNKMTEIPIFVSELDRFVDDFSRAETVLELGGGQLWSSCLVKAKHPQARVIGSDIGAAAIASKPMWEGIFRVSLDGSFACASHDIPLPDKSCDVVYTFQAAHHFGDHEQTMAEVVRILRPGGVLLYLYEPVCSTWNYSMALKRVNKTRSVVREDLLILSNIKRLATANGLKMAPYPPAAIHRPNWKKMFYYAMLRTVPPLRLLRHTSMSLRFSMGS